MNPMNSGTFDITLRDIQRAQEGQRESLSKLLRRVGDLMFVYTYWLTLDPNVAADLSQDTTLHVLKNLNGLKIDKLSTFWVWTYRTALNMVLNRSREHGWPMAAQSNDFDTTTSSPYEPAEHLPGTEVTAAMLGGMAALEFKYRHVLVLRCLGKMPYHEMARILGIGNLEVRLLSFRAKRLLKHRLAHQQFERKHLAAALSLFATTIS